MFETRPKIHRYRAELYFRFHFPFFAFEINGNGHDQVQAPIAVFFRIFDIILFRYQGNIVLFQQRVRKRVYYAQELKENTYNLTRMNLVMRGILPDNIVTRCGDTLDDDWPYFDDNDKENTYEPLTNLDAVVSNPPYSQKWDPSDKQHDPRFNGYGIAPKTKADYAFLLHALYQIRAGGIKICEILDCNVSDVMTVDKISE